MNQKEWTHIIKSRSGWLDVPLAQLWHFRDLIFIFVKRDFTAVYKQTILGPLWHFIQPLFSSFAYSFTFSFIARITTEGVPPVLFYLSGIVPWSYFADCINRTSGTFIGNAGIFGKVYFPRLAVPLSIIISNLIKFGIQLLLFLGMYLFFYLKGGRSVSPTIYLFMIPVLVMIMAVLGMGIGLIVSSFTTRYRDLANLMGFGVQLLMYLSPVIFPLSMWQSIAVNHPGVLWIIYSNPMTSVIETFRVGLLGVGAFDGVHLLYSAGISCLILFAGVVVFSKTEKTFIDTI